MAVMIPKLETVLIVTNSPYETVRNFSINKNHYLSFNNASILQTYDDGAILRYFAADPFRLHQPGQIISLRVVISQFIVRSVDHLLDQSPGDTITFRAERYCSLRVQKSSRNSLQLWEKAK